MKLTKLAILPVYVSLVIIAFISCEDPEKSSDVNQDRIYTVYELIYNSSQNVTYARATFRFGSSQGTLLELTPPSEVTFKGEPLIKTTESGSNRTYYEKKYAGFVNEGTFIWKDTKGKSFENDISIRSIDYPDSLVEISRSDNFELIWKGDPLYEDDMVNLTINNTDTVASDAQILIQDDVNSNSIVLSKDKLEKLSAGNGALYLYRKFNPDLTESTKAGGEIYGTFRAGNIKVLIK